MPADSGAASVLIDPNLLEVQYLVSGESRNLCTKIAQKRRWVFGRTDFTEAVIVAETEGNDTAVSNVAVKFERFQRQSAKSGCELFLFRFADELRLIPKARRRRRSGLWSGIIKQCSLTKNEDTRELRLGRSSLSVVMPATAPGILFKACLFQRKYQRRLV